MDNEMTFDVAVVGAGAAGLTAAAEIAHSNMSVVVLECENYAGGVLGRCIHPGFFGDELEKTGPEYRDELYEKAKALGAAFIYNACVTEIHGDTVEYLAPDGKKSLKCRAVILASGCREKSAGEVGILGARPAGVYTAGEAQRIMNVFGFDIGDNAVILGGGDIGMIVARRLRLNGKTVRCIVEAGEICGAMPKNLRLCAEELDVPVLTECTVSAVHGEDRVSSVTVHNLRTGEDMETDCGALIIAAGLVPENELDDGSDNIFVCGNARHICPDVQTVSEDALSAARSALRYLRTGERIRETDDYTPPPRRKLMPKEKVCTLCHTGCVIHDYGAGISGAGCSRGKNLFRTDVGKRYFSLALPVSGSETMLPVRTAHPAFFRDVAALDRSGIKIERGVKRGDTVYSCAAFDLIACADA